jgi:hypothetical protein
MAKRERGTISPEQIQGALRQGDSPIVLMAKGAFVPGNLVATDADGNAVDSGGTGGGGSTSPLTTKGDLYTHDATADARLPVGSDGQMLVADATQATGLRWQAAPAAAAVPVDEVPTGTLNGTNAAFTLSFAPTAGTLHLSLNGVRQNPSDEFTLVGTTITYTTAPKADDWHRAMYTH